MVGGMTSQDRIIGYLNAKDIPWDWVVIDGNWKVEIDFSDLSTEKHAALSKYMESVIADL